MQRKYYYLICLIALTLLFNCKQKENTQESTTIETINTNDSSLNEALTFYASFDSAIDADFALGDNRLYTVPDRKARDSAQVGLHKPEVTREAGTGKFGAGLVFAKNGPGYIYYPSEDNIVYNNEDWSATISFWLLLDPATDLDPGFCDPIQITDSGYNDAGIWVDFTKENPRDFRLGVIGDREVWNPNPEGPDNANPIFIERLTGISNPPFSRERWTHVVITFSGLNTANGEASLYLNGELQGTRSAIDTPFTWDYALSNIYLGLGYIGVFDELSIYNRALTNAEIDALYNLDGGVHSILK